MVPSAPPGRKGGATPPLQPLPSNPSPPTPPSPTPHPPLEVLLKERIGFPAFRPGQAEIIEYIADEGDALVVMPTGAGKSLCYQLPALARGGVTVVVSPLIALMKDQVDALVAKGVRAALINSTLAPEARRARIAEL